MKQPVTVSLKSVNPVSISHWLVVFACSHYLADLWRIHKSGPVSQVASTLFSHQVAGWQFCNCSNCCGMFTVSYLDNQQRYQHTSEASSLQADSLCIALQISVCGLPVDAIAAIKHRLAYCEAVRNQFPFAVDMLQVKRTSGPHAAMHNMVAFLHMLHPLRVSAMQFAWGLIQFASLSSRGLPAMCRLFWAYLGDKFSSFRGSLSSIHFQQQTTWPLASLDWSHGWLRFFMHLMLQVYKAGPHCKQQPEHLNNTVMAFFSDQGLMPKLNAKEPDLVEVIVPPH